MVEDVSGIVVNVIEWSGNEADWVPPVGYTMVEDNPPAAGPGFTYADGVFTPPPTGEIPAGQGGN
jgi:hypothetical protein